MDKIIKIVFLIIVLSSCSNKKNSNNEVPKIIFNYDKFITVDFEKKELKLNYEGFEYLGKIVLSEKEDSIITNSYKKIKLMS